MRTTTTKKETIAIYTHVSSNYTHLSVAVTLRLNQDHFSIPKLNLEWHIWGREEPSQASGG